MIARAKPDISRLVVMFKTSKAPVTPGLRPGYDIPATEKCWNRAQIVERTYHWSLRSLAIAKATSVAARSYIISTPSHTAYDQVTT